MFRKQESIHVDAKTQHNKGSMGSYSFPPHEVHVYVFIRLFTAFSAGDTMGNLSILFLPFNPVPNDSSAEFLVFTRMVRGKVTIFQPKLKKKFAREKANQLLGPVAQSLVSANRWLRGIRTKRFPWYLTPVSANHASSNRPQDDNANEFLESLKRRR